jgi:hypothetical protein
MGSVNYMQRVGHSSCIRCDFETSDDMPFEEQDAAMMAHLAEKHPNWMTDGAMAKLPKPCPTCGGTGYDNKAGSTVHAPGCECNFCKMGDTRL